MMGQELPNPVLDWVGELDLPVLERLLLYGLVAAASGDGWVSKTHADQIAAKLLPGGPGVQGSLIAFVLRELERKKLLRPWGAHAYRISYEVDEAAS